MYFIYLLSFLMFEAVSLKITSWPTPEYWQKVPLRVRELGLGVNFTYLIYCWFIQERHCNLFHPITQYTIYMVRT